MQQTTHPHPVAEILAAIADRLERGYIDGYCYDADEWQLVALKFRPASNCYYALIEVESGEPDSRFAIYELDGNSLGDDGIFEDPVVVGNSEADFPNGAIDVAILQ